MADATPLHTPKEPKKAPKPAPKPAPETIEEVPHHRETTPGQAYKLPDGTVVRDH